MANNSIALLAKTPVLDTPLESQAKAMQIRQMMNQGEVQDMDIQAKRDTIQRAAGLRSTLAGFKPDAKPDEQVDALTRAGYLTEARSLAESSSKVSKERREEEKFQFEKARDEIAFFNQIISAAKDQASYTQGRQMMAARGMDVSQIPEQFDAAYVAAAGQQTMTQMQRIEQMWKQKGFDLDVEKFGEDKRKNKAQERNQAGQLAVSQANLGVSRDRLAVERAAPKGQVIQTEDGPILVDPRTGRSIPVLGGDGKAVGKTKAPTEFQGKSAAFGARADQADKIITSLQGKYNPSAINAKQAVEDVWLVGGAMGAATNKFALDENDQKAEQAQRDFINAVLRQESGAAIGASEFDNAKKQYFPQPGDKPATLKQKAENRRLAVKGFQVNAGRAGFSTDAVAPGAEDDIHAQAAAILGGK